MDSRGVLGHRLWDGQFGWLVALIPIVYEDLRLSAIKRIGED